MARKSRSLRDYVYRVLTLRVAVAVLVLCAVLVATVVVTSRNEVGEVVVETAVNRIRILRERTLIEMEASGAAPEVAFRGALDSLLAAGLEQRLGSFVWSRFYDRQGAIVAESVAPGLLQGSEILGLTGPELRSLSADGPWHRVFRRAGRPHVHLVVPVAGPAGKARGIAEGIFALSDAALAELRGDLLRTVLWVVAIVLVTAAILFPVILQLTRRIAVFSDDLLASHLETVQTLGSAIAKRDSDTSAHNFRVTIVSVWVAETMGLERTEIQRLIIGAFLHDVGKIGIRDDVLLKPARLDNAEFEVMKTHVGHGVDIVSRTEWLLEKDLEHINAGEELLAHSNWLEAARDVVSGHHEKFDGSGYPRGLARGEIPQVARIFAVVDVFDALTCERPYKKPFSYEKSMAILEKGRGSHFDPQVLDVFCSLAEEVYRSVAGREDERLRGELDEVTRRYFHAGLNTLEV
jgi:HD-GYP domain-containing protein (c-di-GMP phosphodiesterase class II)